MSSKRGGKTVTKRRAFLKTTGVAATAALAGCGGDGGDGDDTTTETTTGGMTTTSTSTTAQTQSVTLNYVDVDGDRTKEMFMPIVSELEAEHNADITLKFEEVPYENLKRDLLTRVGGGNAPDIAAIDQIWLGAFAESGKLMDLSAVADDVNFDDYFQGFQPAVQQNDSVVGFPITTDVRGLYWNKDHFRDAGLDPETPPATWSELVSMGQQVHDPPARYGAGIIVNAGLYSIPLFSLGGRFLNEDATEPMFHNEAGVEAARFYDRIHNDQQITPPQPVTSGQSFPQEYLQGQYTMNVAYGSWLDFFWRNMQGDMSAEEADQAMKEKFGFDFTPVKEGAEKATMSGGFAWAAFNTTDYPDIVQGFMRRVSGKEFNKTVAVETGRMPTRKSLLDEPEIWDPILYSEKMKEMLEYTHTRPVNNWSLVSEHVGSALQSVSFGEKEPQAAMDEAAQKVRNNL